MNETEQILTSILKCRRIDLYSAVKLALSVDDQVKFDEIRNRRKTGEPLQYILGSCDFMGININVDTRVLIPRPETEILVESALKRIIKPDCGRPIEVLDIGTGSGNIPIALAKNLSDCHVTAIDISPESLSLAKCNAKMNYVDDKIEFICMDLNDFFMFKNKRTYDLIISNPPYIRSEDMVNLPVDVKHEPSSALDGGPDGLCFYRDIIRHSYKHLTDEGLLMCEIGDGQAEHIVQIFNDNPFYKDIGFIKDYVSTERIFFSKKL